MRKMGLFPEVKCTRCDRRYSRIKTRCPYCGARRNKKGKRATAPNNAVWKLVIGILLLVILIAAVVVLLVTAERDTNTAEELPSPSPTYEASEGVNSVQILPEETTPSPSPSASPSPAPKKIESLKVTYLGDELPISEEEGCNYDVTMGIAESIQLGYEVKPEDTGEKVQWKSSDTGIVTVLENGQVTAISEGTAHVTLQIGDVSVVCKIRVG